MDAGVIATTDADRYPTLSAHGRAMLQLLREHPAAPLFRNQSGNRLHPADIERVRAFEAEIATARIEHGGMPYWVEGFVADVWERVPYFRAFGPRPRAFYDLPTTSRAELGKDCAQFVPDDVPIERMINFRTSGTSGHPILIPSHPVVAASYLAFHKRSLRRFGIELRHGRGQVGVILLGFQRKCFTYVSVTPTMDESGLAKINLHPDDWRHPDDRRRYLEAMAPEVIAGDPLSFAELLELNCELRPRAIFSTSMMLLPGMRRQLEERFRCVVLDLYSMNEAGPIAAFDPKENGHVLLQPRMHVEILAGSRPAEAGERGEITLTGGFNFCLPLIRYRTGDFASLRFAESGEPVLVGLQGRPAVRFRTADGRWLNNIEVTHALQAFALPQFTLHQFADTRVLFRSASSPDPLLREALERLFGSESPLDMEFDVRFEDKVIQYTTDLENALP